MDIILTCNFSPWSPYSGGGQQSTHELATALAARGHRVSVVFTRPPFEDFEIPQNLGYQVIWASFFALRSWSSAPLRSLNALSVARAVGKILSCTPRPVVVHGQGEESALIPRLQFRSPFAFVITPRYPSYPEGLQTGRPFRRLFVLPKYKILGATIHKADGWCPTSRASADSVVKAFGQPAANCTVVPNGVAHAFFAVERRHDATSGPIVFHGRLARSKGADTLLDALAIAGILTPVVFVGRGPAEKRLRRRARRLGLNHVEFSGWQSQAWIAELLSRASLSVLPSREESFGNAMVEAMAAGVPLVSTRVGAVPEVAVADTSALVAPNDPGALAEAIVALRADHARAERLGQAGRLHARAHYSWDKSAEQFETVYRQVLAGRLSP